MNNTLEDLEAPSSGVTRSDFILEPDTIPDWFLVLNEFDRSACYMVCEAYKSPGVGIKASTDNPTFGMSFLFQKIADAIALGTILSNC